MSLSADVLKASLSTEVTLKGKVTSPQALQGKVNVPNRYVGPEGPPGKDATDCDHNDLRSRDVEDCHPIESITGLEKQLDNKLNDADIRPLTNMEIEELLK